MGAGSPPPRGSIIRRRAPTRFRSLGLLPLLAACSGSDSVAGVRIDDLSAEPFLHWPMPGADGVDWVINNYVDLDPGSGLLDYNGGLKVYDGHRGTDIDVPNFRWMDADFPILAAAPGEIVSTHDGEFDRNTSCAGRWNQVTVQHEDGSRAVYGHLKRNSIQVAVGTIVSVGDTLGVVGSSGCSTAPHLHLEILDAAGIVVDPFRDGLWLDPPLYDAPLTFMDFSFRLGPISDVDQIKDPPPNVTAIGVGSTMGVGLSMAGGGPTDQIALRITDGDGSVAFNGSITFDRVWRHTYWYWNVPIEGSPGAWEAVVSVNGVPVATHDLTVG